MLTLCAFPGSAADKAGVGVGDWIVAVNGESTKGKTAFDIIDEINEAKDPSKVTMTILPAAHVGAQSISDYTREVTLERTVQKIGNPVRYKISEERPDGTKVGFIRILEFNSQVVPKLQEALQELSKAGSNAYVIDLRHNGGGAFQSAVEISSLFLKNRIATYVVDNSQTKLPFATAKNADPVVDSTAPLVIWLDSKSASASEVLAGSLHDNCRAVLMGDTSFGKGLIQAVYGLKNGAGLVLTVARYVTPAGTDIQGSGISPDISGHVAPPIPGLSTDTSGVDFADVRQRLSMCQVPPAL